MKDFYTCPECRGTDFTWTKYPDIYCYTCHALHVVVALSFDEISRRLNTNVQEEILLNNTNVLGEGRGGTY